MSPPATNLSDVPENHPLLADSLAELENSDLGTTVTSKNAERCELEQSLLKKLDRRMSILILIYILNYIDRNNASAARLWGFEDDLGLTGNQFASILSVLYIGYIIMQVPSNMVLEQAGRPSIYLSSCMCIWGLISILTGFTTNFFGALCTRFFLGFVEAAFFPGALFLLSKWYTRKELSQRMALLFSGSLISNALGTLVASGILKAMNGVFGFAAWRWLFFVEGAITVFVAVLASFILPDFPESSSPWLTPREQVLAVKRMVEDAEDQTIGDRRLKTLPSYIGLQLALMDWKVWWLSVAIGAMTVSLSFNAYFPTLSATMGYSTTISLLLCAPPWVFATVIAYAVSRHSDYHGERCWHITIPYIVGILGFLIAIATSSNGLRFFMTQSYAGYVCFLAWSSGSISEPPSKRAVALAIVNSGATIGNIVGSYIWPKVWGPTYSLSYAICITASLVAVGMCFVFRWHLASLNREMSLSGTTGQRYLL